MQSPAAQGMARSLSEIVQQLFADDQLSRDCAQALSVQIGGGPNASLQQMQGMLHMNQSHTSAVCKNSAVQLWVVQFM